MRVSLRWLQAFVPHSGDADSLAERLTLAGLELERCDDYARFDDAIVVGEVRAVAPHPDADKLRVCTVWDGEQEQTVVCGAPNVCAGMSAPFARIGATLPDGTRIKKAKLRGVVSHGMLCSGAELQLTGDSDGLLRLDTICAQADIVPGTPFAAIVGDDTVLELAVTPNRGDCLSMIGIAREVAMVEGNMPTPPPPVVVTEHSTARRPVRVEAADACPRYLSCVIEDIDARAVTPLWLRIRLERAGLRAISPVVDVTNYVMLTLGQPLHAFDADVVSGEIVVRHARDGERLLLLDGTDAALHSDDLLICHGETPVAIAGVMGGKASGVNDATTAVVLESAFFTPTVIAGRTRRFGIHSDAAYRFERGVDYTIQRQAITMAAALLLDITGGRAGPIVEAVDEASLPTRAPIDVRSADVASLLGHDVDAALIVSAMTALGIAAERQGVDVIVTPPPYRYDMVFAVDVAEEVTRYIGVDAVAATIPHFTPQLRAAAETVVSVDHCRDVLVARGYHEVVTYAFIAPQLHALLSPNEPALSLANPIAADLSLMRTSLWPGLLRVAERNNAYAYTRLRLFEVGVCFVPDGNTYIERRVIAGLLLGTRAPRNWCDTDAVVDFFDAKGDIIALAASLHRQLRCEAAVHPALHPGKSARVYLQRDDGEIPVGWVGVAHPQVTEQLSLPTACALFTLDTEPLLQRRIPRYRAFSRMPPIRRDIAVLVPKHVSSDTLLATIRALAIETLVDVGIFDVYLGASDDGRNSIGLSLTFRAMHETLTDATIDVLVERIVDTLGQNCDATLRQTA